MSFTLFRYSIFFFFYSSVPHLDLHSFPTRRSSDLLAGADDYRGSAGAEALEHGGESPVRAAEEREKREDRKSTRLNSSHRCISYAVFCLKKKNKKNNKAQQYVQITKIKRQTIASDM